MPSMQAAEDRREKLRASPFPFQLRFSQGYTRLEHREQALLLAARERLDALLTPPPE